MLRLLTISIVSLTMWAAVFVASAAAQRERGELRLDIRDPQGAALAASGELTSAVNQFKLTFQAGDDGSYVARDLVFGNYLVRVNHAGFMPATALVEIRSTLPRALTIQLGLTPVETQVQVEESATLVDPGRIASVYVIGSQSIRERSAAQPGRAVLDVVNAQPGWLYEANGTLHPRGSEYDVQFVVDGLPLLQNRSPAFAVPFESGEVESMRIMTSGFPAEYGRKLGGVVEITSPKNTPIGLHAEASISGSTLSTVVVHVGLFYATGKNRFSASADGFHSDRYLDPPVIYNFTNRGNAGGYTASYERDFSEKDRLFLTVTRHAVRFLVPNELIQQQAGQRQDAAQQESSGSARYSHIFTPDLLMSVSGSLRDTTALLSSNAKSLPVIVAQDRGYREGYLRADLAGHHGIHEWKTGVDGMFTPVHEMLRYEITDPNQFEEGIRRQFQFADRRWDVESSGYVQDQIRMGRWSVNAGLRFDRYKFVVSESAFSPRIGIARTFAPLSLVVHASYDRVFQTPATENLLLASSSQLDALNTIAVRLPVRPARANYFEAGFSKAVAGKLRIEGNVFRRNFHNFADDDTLLDTGVSFPIAFANARIYGAEVQIAAPRWGRFSGFVSYSNQVGIGNGPITGGLFLGTRSIALSDNSSFPISQDQRYTIRSRIRLQASSRIWIAAETEYGSGLPAHLDEPGGLDTEFLRAQYGTAILSRVNFNTERVRPNFSMDAAVGATIFHKEMKEVSVQMDVRNLTNRVNVLNFASLFSGTAVAAPRSAGIRFRAAF